MAKQERNTLLGDITKRAIASFSKEIGEDDEGFNEWWHHWMDTAETVYQEFVDEGLTQTAAAVREHIEFQRKYTKPKEKTNA